MKRAGLILSLASMLGCIQPLHALSDEAKTGLTVAGITVGSYALGRAITYRLYKSAYKRYDTARAIIVGYEYDEPSLRNALKQEIILDNESDYDRTSPYRNYPLVCYKNNLDWYITWLNRMRFFAFGSDLRTQLREFADDLNRIKRYVITDPAFIHERRLAEEREEQRTHIPEVIVHHRR